MGKAAEKAAQKDYKQQAGEWRELAVRQKKHTFQCDAQDTGNQSKQGRYRHVVLRAGRKRFTQCVKVPDGRHRRPVSILLGRAV
jgi:hypothetical protein